jgi:cAMP-dependent protein kinase regulator
MYNQQQDVAATMNARSARDFLNETRRRREEIIESLRRPSITPVVQPAHPPPQQFQQKNNEMDVDVPAEKRFEMVDDRFQNVDTRLRKIEAAIIQNNIGGVDLETLNRAKRELQKIKLQYIQTTTQTEEIINKLLQENQYLRSKLIDVEEENEHLKALDDDEYPTKRRRMSFDSYVPIRRVSVDSTGEEDSSTSQQGIGFQVQSPPRLEVTYPTGYNPLKRRFSVSSESFNPDQVNVAAKIIPKSEETKASIRENIKHNLLFKNLSEDRIEEVVNAMTEVKYLPNDTVIKEGDDGENMYVIDQGELNVLYASEIVATLGPGKAFGEIALMYNCPRTATIKAKTECKLWAMDRNTFRRILMSDSIKRRALYESFLAKVPIFESLIPYERSKVADALEPVNFNDGHVIIREGDTDGDKFYIVEKGEVVCTKTSTDKSTSVEASRLNEGGYFGELSLLTRQPRQATVTAHGPVKCLAISRDHFVQVMGPCEEILKRNMVHYATYEELIKQSKTQSAKEAVNNEKAKEVDPSNKDHHDRLSLVNDLIATENEYIAVCMKIIEGYLLPMRSQTDLKISKEEIEMVFCNIEEIIKLHENFISHLEKNKQDLLVGEVISQFANGLRLYERYVGNYFNSLFLRNKHKTSPSHNKFLKSRLADPRVGGVDLDKLLEVPFQRLPKYTKLVKQMLNLTDDKHPDRPYLQIAMKILLEIENTYEKVKRKLERLFNIQNNISGEHENFVDPKRQLKREEELTALNDSEKMKSYFFTDLIVFTKTIDVGSGESKEVHFKTIPLSECQIAKGDAHVRIIWKNRNGKTESMDFSIQSPQMKSWAEDIERAVADLSR